MPICWRKIKLETLLFEDRSGVKTTRPSNKKDTDKVKIEGGSKKSAVQVVELSDSDDASHIDQEPYVTPFLLEKKRRKIAPAPEDTEEESEVEQQLKRKASKKTGPVKSSTEKVRWSVNLLTGINAVDLVPKADSISFSRRRHPCPVS